MNTDLASHLFNLGFLSIATASLVFVFLAEGSRQSIAGGSRAVPLKLGPLALVFLLASATVALVGAENSSTVELGLRLSLALLLFAVACLFSLALYFLRLTLALVHLDTASNLLDRWPLWLGLLIVPLASLAWGLASSATLSPINSALIGFSVGYLASMASLRKYLQYGFSNYEEALNAPEWYEKLVAFVGESMELYITAITPGFVLPSEFDPVSYPVAGQVKSSVRKNLFETYLAGASAGLRIKFLFDMEETLKVIRIYQHLGLYDRYRKVSEELLNRINSTGNIEIRYRPLEQDSQFRKASVISDRGVMLSERTTLKKIRHGEVIQNQSLASGHITSFLQKDHWAEAIHLTADNLNKLWDSALSNQISK